MKIKVTLLFAFFYLFVCGQTKLLTIQDAVLKGRTSLAPKRLQNLVFVPNSNVYSFIDNSTIFLNDNATAKTKTKVELSDLNKSLKTLSLDTLTAMSGIIWKDESQFSFTTPKGDEIVYTPATSTGVKKEKAPVFENADKCPVNDFIAYTKDNNVFIYKVTQTSQVTRDGSYTLEYGTEDVHRNEFGISKGTFWSPKGNFLAFYKMDQCDVDDYPIVDWTAYPAKNVNVKYPMAGKKSHQVSLGVYNLETKSTIYLKIDGPKDQYLTNVAWSLDEKFIYMAVLNREQNHFKLNEYDAQSGNFTRTLFEEKEEKYVEPLHPIEFLKASPNQFIWQSRRDGFNHIYLYDIKGNVVKQLTKGNWEVKDVNGFDEKCENLFFHANEQSLVNQDFYSVNLKTAKITRLTTSNGFHICVLNSKREFFIDNFSSCFVPRETKIINIKTLKGNTILNAENPIKDYKLGKWNLFTIKNTEGTDLYCRLFKPVDFDSTKKYPVVVYLYNGPHSQLVTNTWMANGELWYQYMAEKGFIVFTLDGRGTSHRGKAFEQAIHRQLGTKEMEDQISGVNYLKTLPFVDGNRIGVHGWSFGGFMTTSLMTRYPDVFKVGVCGGPVIDWSYYEIMYGERYMDTPQENPEGYAKNNTLNYVDKLKGKLLMIHGAQDPVVVWQHSMMYLKKATEKNIQLDYYVYPGHEHNVLGKDRAHLMDKICNYFIEHL
ncbi:MAG: DPP IV N-terminal domain-containing protein [Bacteroidota bacterium]|nr:DPP IV N-terminal domain-containing protein [Bacteroidota bacterium]